MFEMGACMSSNNDEVLRKKHSQAIDKQLEEDSKKLRRECKILLLGTKRHLARFTQRSIPCDVPLSPR